MGLIIRDVQQKYKNKDTIRDIQQKHKNKDTER